MKTITPIPLMVSPGTCVGWFDFADERTIVSSGGAVSKVWNKSSVANHLTQGTAAKQPATGSRTKNGLNVLDFDGSSDYMVFDSNTILSVPFTVFIVAAYDSSTNLMCLFGRQTASIAGQFSLRKESSGYTFNTFAFGSGGLSSQVSKSGNDNSANIHTVYFDNNVAINYRLNNGTASTGTARSGYDNAVATPVGLGVTDTNSPGGYFDGYVGELIVYNAILSTDQIAQISQYLGRKWGITVS